MKQRIRFNSMQGFTLIEVMIVVAILGILSAIAIGFYQKYTIRAANSACLYEAKAYSNQVFLALNDQEGVITPPPVPENKACIDTTDASLWTRVNQQQLIVANAKSPGNLKIICDLPHGVPCRFDE